MKRKHTYEQYQRWTQLQQQWVAHRKARARAKEVADRLLGKKKELSPMSFFGGTQMRSPIQYRERNSDLQNAGYKVGQLAKELDVKVLWAQEPGEAARKRREQEEQHG
jgi:hypothetical protein